MKNKQFNQRLNKYIQSQLSQSPFRLRTYVQDERGEKYLTRNIYIKIKKYIDNFLAGKQEIRMVAVPGLRGVGKTTLLAQIFFYVYPRFSENLLYLSVDEAVNILESDLYSALQEYEKILGKVFERAEEKIFILIDEIHYDKKWPIVLKSIFDRSKNVFILCTGSSALSLQTKNADIARRVIFEKMYPMDFTEYLLLKSQSLHSRYKEAKVKFPPPDLKRKVKEAIFDSPDAKSCYSNLKKLEKDINRYWMDIDRLEIDRYLKFGTMPFAIKIEDEGNIYNFINELIDRVVEKDIIELGRFNIDTIKKIKSILLMVASSDEISVTSLAKNIGNISVNTLIDIFDILEEAEVLIRVYPYGSIYKKVRKPSKYLFMSSALRVALLTVVEGRRSYEKYKGKFLEDIVAMYFYRSFDGKLVDPIYYDSSKNGADFILKQGLNKKIIIEIGFKKESVQQVLNTKKKISACYGLVIGSGALELTNNEVVKIPLSYFLLM